MTEQITEQEQRRPTVYETLVKYGCGDEVNVLQRNGTPQLGYYVSILDNCRTNDPRYLPALEEVNIFSIGKLARKQQTKEKALSLFQTISKIILHKAARETREKK